MSKENCGLERAEASSLDYAERKQFMQNLKRAGIAAAVVVAGVVALKLLPMSWTLSAVVGFAGGVVSTYLWRNKQEK